MLLYHYQIYNIFLERERFCFGKLFTLLKNQKQPQHLGGAADFFGEGNQVSYKENAELKKVLENCKVVCVSIRHRRRPVLANLW